MIIAISIAAVAAVAGAALVVLGVAAQRRRARADELDDLDDLDDHHADPPRRLSAAGIHGGADPPTTIERLRILIVDDDARAGRVIARLLRDHDTIVTSGNAALVGLTADDKFDAILCSLTMASMSGISFAATVSANHPALQPRIIFLAGGATTPETQRLLALSDIRWVTKPVQYAPLAICLGEVVAAARRAEQTSPRAISAAG
jgi:CheY-like chemotaxis protein